MLQFIFFFLLRACWKEEGTLEKFFFLLLPEAEEAVFS